MRVPWAPEAAEIVCAPALGDTAIKAARASESLPDDELVGGEIGGTDARGQPAAAPEEAGLVVRSATVHIDVPQDAGAVVPPADDRVVAVVRT